MSQTLAVIVTIVFYLLNPVSGVTTIALGQPTNTTRPHENRDPEPRRQIRLHDLNPDSTTTLGQRCVLRWPMVGIQGRANVELAAGSMQVPTLFTTIGTTMGQRWASVGPMLQTTLGQPALAQRF